MTEQVSSDQKAMASGNDALSGERVAAPGAGLLYEPPDKAMQAAEPIARAIFDSNGNPTTLRLDEVQVRRVAAFAIDAIMKAIRGESW